MRIKGAAVVVSLSLAVAAAASAQSREHVVCYQAKPVKKACSSASSQPGLVCKDDIECPGGLCEKQPKFPKTYFAQLNDVTGAGELGEDKSFQVKKVKQLCVPVEKNSEGIGDPDTFWVTYQVKQLKAACSAGSPQPGIGCKENADCSPGTCDPQPKFDKKAAENTNIFVEDQLTNIRLDASKVDLLMVPATLCDGDDDAACVSGANAQPAAGAEEHYKCYKARGTKKLCLPESPINALSVCKDDSDCGGAEDSCAKLDKFAKGVHAYVSDVTPGLNTTRTFDISKLTHICKAVEKTVVPGGSPEGTVDSSHRLLCYKTKASKGQCDIASPLNALGACKKEEHCGGIKNVTTHCDLQGKYDKNNPLAQGLYVNDQFDLVPGSDPTVAGDYHRINASKEQMFCAPACADPDEILSFTDDVVRAVTLEIPATGDPGDGQDVDGNPGTCQPAGCSGGIDNVLGVLAGLIPDLNTALQDAVAGGDINIVLELDQFANGAQTANGFTGDLDDPAGCTDQSDGGQICNYAVESGIDAAACEKQASIEFPVTIAGLPGSPATVLGGGVGSNLELDLPFGSTPLQITARNVKVGADVVHAGGTISTASGALGGALVQRELKATINNLPEGLCDGGVNNDQPCTVATAEDDCGSGITCNTFYLGGFDKAFVASAFELFLVRDIDTDGQRTCEGGGNNGEPCTTLGFDPACPDPAGACDDFDAHSLGIKFTAIDAAIGSSSLTCDKATCSLY